MECYTPDLPFPSSVLDNILSRLSLKEAVATSILSKTWRFAWCSIRELDFVGPTTLQSDQDKEVTKYINQVSSIVEGLKKYENYEAFKNYEGSKTHERIFSVQSFKLRCSLNNSNYIVIDKWIEFAFRRDVEVLELNFETLDVDVCDTNLYYNLPYYFLEWGRPFCFKELSFSCVNVANEIFPYLLESAPYLETLSLLGVGLLSNVVVVNNASIKTFFLMGCPKIKTIYIHDSGLETFYFSGQEAIINFKNVPNLKDVGIGEVGLGKNNGVYKTISSIASHLELLWLDVDREMEDIDVESIPDLPNVKSLKLTLPTQEKEDTVMAFIDIAKKCPKLESFIVSLQWDLKITENKAEWGGVGHKFPKLKHLEICGFRGLASDGLFITYMIGNARDSLQTVVIDTSSDLYAITENERKKLRDDLWDILDKKTKLEVF